ncbi:unnamed protein product, partial [marine sediment metagenome]
LNFGRGRSLALPVNNLTHCPFRIALEGQIERLLQLSLL